MRQLVTLRKVDELIPIDGADVIELARIDGWQCVVKKGDFAVGERGLFFEIDSLIPADDERFKFLSRGQVRTHHRIKSMKLRGALSQGLLMPWTIITGEENDRAIKFGAYDLEPEGNTLTDIFNVEKYEPSLPMGGQQKGTFPTGLVPKTDQERIQNCKKLLDERYSTEFEVTEKLDGTSCTMFHVMKQVPTPAESPHDCATYQPHTGVCSRNWEMEQADSSVYARVFQELDMHNKLRSLNRNVAIQGEIVGPNIQKNLYKLDAPTFYVFSVYDIDEQRYMTPSERYEVVSNLHLTHVPVLDQTQIFGVVKDFQFAHLLDLDTVLAAADGMSLLNGKARREGLVFKHHTEQFSFKAISNKWLLKHE